MPRPLLTTVAFLALAAGLGACASSRLDGPVRGRGPSPQAALDGVPAMPSGPITSAPLAPPPGVAAAPVDAPIGADVAVAAATAVIAPEPSVASIAPPAPPPVVVASGRSSVVGSWTAKDATGATCRVSLSSAPALDLYKASAAACPNKDLSKVTAWDYRDGEVYLYQPGGTVTARLRQGGGALDGALSKSGASLAMVR